MDCTDPTLGYLFARMPHLTNVHLQDISDETLDILGKTYCNLENIRFVSKDQNNQIFVALLIQK